MSDQSTDLSFSNRVGYDQKVEITIRLKAVLDKKDYKAVGGAAEIILKTLEKYLTPESPNPKDRSKQWVK